MRAWWDVKDSASDCCQVVRRDGEVFWAVDSIDRIGVFPQKRRRRVGNSAKRAVSPAYFQSYEACESATMLRACKELALRCAGIAVVFQLCHANVSFAQPAERGVPMDAAMQIGRGWFDRTACRERTAHISVEIGDAQFEFPIDIVENLMPSRADRIALGADGGMTAFLPANVGCRESPAPAARVELSPEGAQSPIGVLLSEHAPRNGLSARANGLLQMRSSGQCEQAEVGLLRCGGVQTVQGQRQPVQYFLASDAAETQLSGAPLHALCVMTPQGATCGVSDDLPGRVEAQMPLGPGAPTLESIRAAHARMTSLVEGYRRVR